MSGHAKFGSPSGMSALKACPGKLAMSKGLKQVPASSYSIEGTHFHSRMQTILPAALSGKQWKTFLVKDPGYPEMLSHTKEATERTIKFWKGFKAKHDSANYYIEMRVTLDKKKDIWGTADIVFVGTHKKTKKVNIFILDWKYGQGVIVKAEKNLQGVTYALGAVKTLGIPYSAIGVVHIEVAQLRLEEGWSSFIVKGEDLSKWEQEVFKIVSFGKQIYDGEFPLEGNLHPGDCCRFCPANYWSVCPAQKEYLDAPIITSAIELPVEEAIKKLTLDQQVNLFLKKSAIEDILNAIAANLNRVAMVGLKHPKIKVVEKRGHRSWRYLEETTVKKLQGMGIKKPFKTVEKLIGIPEAEGILGKAKVAKLVIPGKMKREVVAASDYRTEVKTDEPEELE